MNRRGFKFTLPDKVIRSMNRKQYYTVMSWLRLCARKIHNETNWPTFNKYVVDMALYGQSSINRRDLKL